MDNRLVFHEKLKAIVPNVYFQPPSSNQIVYPAIIYKLNKIKQVRADNKSYSAFTAYEVMLVDRNPDSEFVEKILEFPKCEFDRFFPSDNLNHYVFTIYV